MTIMVVLLNASQQLERLFCYGCTKFTIGLLNIKMWFTVGRINTEFIAATLPQQKLKMENIQRLCPAQLGEIPQDTV